MTTNIARDRRDRVGAFGQCELPRIYIILTENDTENGTDDKSPTWHPGDPLKGYLQISSTVQPTSMSIRVFFKGTTRTWIVLDNPDVFNVKTKGLAREFLNQSQRLRYEAGLYEEAGTGEFIYKIAFNFTIPTKLLSHDPTINEQLLQLPPSFKAGEAITDTAGQTFMQPLIDYILQAVVHFDGLVPGPPVKVQSAREIMLVPFTEIGPPLATEDFPGEYTSISTRSLSKIPFGGLFGEMSISMDEPPALRFSEGLLSARSLGYLKLILRPKDDVANTIKQRRLKCTIKSGIVVKVFSSMTPLHGMPTYSMLQTDKYLRVRARHVSLQTRRVDVFLSKADGQPLPGGSRERQDFTWTTSLYLPIYSTKLLPTFCSTQAALCYALRVQLNFSGVYHSPFVLNVPLQVLHCKEAETVRVGWIAVDYYDQRTIDNQIDVLDVSSQLPELERLPPAYNCD